MARLMPHRATGHSSNLRMPDRYHEGVPNGRTPPALSKVLLRALAWAQAAGLCVCTAVCERCLVRRGPVPAYLSAVYVKEFRPPLFPVLFPQPLFASQLTDTKRTVGPSHLLSVRAARWPRSTWEGATLAPPSANLSSAGVS